MPKPLPGRDTVIQYGMALLTIVLIAAPLLPVLYQSFLDRALYDFGQQLTLGNFGRLLRTDGFALVIWNTFVFATLTTVISQTLGTLAAVLFGRTDMPFARLFGELFLWPIYLSALVLSFGWYTIYGPAGYLTLLVQSIFDGVPWIYSLPGMAMIAGVSQAPVAYIYCMLLASITDPTLEEAARVTGAGTLRTLWRITPPLTPAIAYSAVLNFTVGLELLAIPPAFGDPAGITVLTTFLYNNGVASARPDHGLVATAAVLMLAVVCVLVWLQGRLLGNTRRFVTLGGKATRPRPFRLNNLRWPLCIGDLHHRNCRDADRRAAAARLHEPAVADGADQRGADARQLRQHTRIPGLPAFDLELADRQFGRWRRRHCDGRPDRHHRAAVRLPLAWRATTPPDRFPAPCPASSPASASSMRLRSCPAWAAS